MISLMQLIVWQPEPAEVQKSFTNLLKGTDFLLLTDSNIPS